ncbi:hypothetical protein N7532_003293 [Penicillium argentinense]|uniref:Uncharacterized protein n=1 Tax=Penicillium argentinense TaxID=1131581 RepID=A0A9W9KDV3_9EURO|nr:uncharacterized protein N7532_003293 [Penicillium argentinense]KAJ5102764.1 hypothetical protein N7532_003293 [Penicillium argentinense]
MPPKRTIKKKKNPAEYDNADKGRRTKTTTKGKAKSKAPAEEEIEIVRLKRRLTEEGKWRTSPSSQTLSASKNANKPLDLEVSYVGKIKLPEKPRKNARHKRWQHKGPHSLDDMGQIPDDWTESEPDLSDDDFDAQIKRCKERIEDNILVSRFQAKLKQLEDDKEKRDIRIAIEPAGLSWDVIQRINCLKSMEEDLQKEDPYDQRQTVRALMMAYRTKKLDWNPGLVTYWVKDRQISQPRLFNWDEFDQIKWKYAKDIAIWVEGNYPPQGGMTKAKFSLSPDYWNNTYELNLSFRFGVGHPIKKLKMLDDTGASIMVLYEQDILDLLPPPRPATIPPNLVMGRMTTHQITGPIHGPVFKLEASLKIVGHTLFGWTPIDVFVLPGRAAGTSTRLMGPLLRAMLYTATAPDQRKKIFVSDDRQELIDWLPAADMTIRHILPMPHLIGPNPKGAPVFM